MLDYRPKIKDGKVQKGKGNWRVRVMVNGKTISRTFGDGQGGKIRAQQFEVEMKKSKYQPIDKTNGDMLLGELIDLSVQSITINLKRKTNQENYKQKLEILKSLLGHKQLSTLSLLDMDLVQTKLSETGIIGISVNGYTNLLVRVLDYGVKCQLVNSNPFKSYRKMREKDASETRNPFSLEELNHFLNWLPDGLLRDITLTLGQTGMRIGELINLNWENVNCEYIHVKARSDWSPKSKAGERAIPLTNQVKEVLARRRESSIPFPFSSKTGTRLFDRNIRTLWDEAKEKYFQETGIDIRGKRLHDLRHGFGFISASKLSLQSLMKIMGHSSIEETVGYSSQTMESSLLEWKQRGNPFD